MKWLMVFPGILLSGLNQVKGRATALICIVLVTSGIQAQVTQPMVAVHDSELTRALETMPAVAPTPTGAGTTGNQWWTLDWHYFVMPEGMQEALRSDGTRFVKVGDSNVTSGALMSGGLPKYPIVISLASEAIRDDEIAQFTNYVAAGGFMFVGGSAFTRNTNGTTRGDFAFANAMGVHMVLPGVTNWVLNNGLTKAPQSSHRLVAHIPDGQLSWRMPSSSDEISWGTSPNHPYLAPHDLWRVSTDPGVTVLAQADVSPYLIVKPYGKGYFIYDAAFQPLIGHGGFAPGMYAYVIIRRAIEWAFEAQNMPVPKISPWPYPYDAAWMVRHDLENFTNEIAQIEASALVEFTNGAKGDYFFCTGTLRDDASPTYDTNAIIAGMRRAVTNYGSTICPHNGGLKNPNNPALVRGQYDWFHWGPDEALDVIPPGYPSGKAYALASVSNSFNDMEGWLAGITNGARIWNACYFNATREDSKDIQAQLNVKVTGDEKISPFPHWTLSSLTSGKRYQFVTEPVSDWFVGGLVAQSLEPWHPPGVQTVQTLHSAIDFYYGLGALVNFYSHTLSTGLGDAGQLVPEYIAYSLNTNLHPRIWPSDSFGVYNWWLQRSNTAATVTYTTNGHQCVTTMALSGAGNTNAAVEFILPATGLPYSLQVLTNNTLATTAVYRTNGQFLKLRVGTTVTNATLRYILGPKANNDFYNAISGTTLTVPGAGVMANDSPGLASTMTAALVSGPSHGTLNLNANGSFTYTPAANFFGIDVFTYQAVGDVTNVNAATVTISVLAPGSLFGDDFTRGTDPGPLAPWIVQSGNWSVTGGVMRGGTNTLSTYAFTYVTNSFSDYAVQARMQFPAGAFGGGLGGRLDPTTGAHYAGWIYPENSPGGSNVLKLVKFQNWGSFTVLQQVNLAAVGTGFHTVKLGFFGNQIAVYFDGVEMMSVTDPQPYLSGGISLDMWTDTIGYVAQADDVLATGLVPGDNYTMNQNTTLNVAAPGVLGNDTEVFGTTLAAALLSGPTNGTFNLTNNGGFSYTPPNGFSGAVTFTYQANDGATNLGSATATINVGSTTNAGNTPPVLPGQANRTINELTTLTVTNTATDTDVPAQTLTYSLLAGPTNASISGAGVITWTPTEAQGPSTNTFTTRVVDNGSPPLSATNSFTVTVNEVNTAPTLPAQADRTITALNTLTVTNTGSDTDIPANTLSYSLLSGPTNASISAAGVITWTPTAAQGGTTNTITTRVVDNGSPPLSATNSFQVVVIGSPVIVVDSTSLTAESCLPTNNAIDPGETVTVLFALKNTGGGNANNLVATLLATNGVAVPSGPQTYGALLAGGAAVTQPFTFANSGTCGGTITATLQLQDGQANLGTTTVTLQLGQVATIFSENFDGVSAPALPAGWTSSGTGAATNWVTEVTNRDTLPNGAYTRDASNIGISELDSPIISLPAGSSQLSFRNYYDVEYNTLNTNVAWDGCVMEIKIGTNVFADILAAGGTFASNGYNRTITNIYGNPLSNRAAWSGNSGGFISTVVNLPAAAGGQNIQLRWRLGTDNGNGTLTPNTGWRIDTVAISAHGCCLNGAPTLPAQSDQTVNELSTLVVTNTASDSTTAPGNLNYSLVNPPSGAGIDTNGVISWTPSEAQGPGTNVITTVVSDDSFPPLSATNSFTVVVNEINSPPVLPAQSDRTTVGVATLVVTNTATDSDLPVNALAYSLATGPSNAVIDGNGIITWTPLVSQVPSTNVFTTVVTDNNPPAVNSQHLSATNSFQVVVVPLHNGPALAAQGNRTINEQTLLLVTNTASDSDIPALNLTYQLLNPPPGALIDGNGVITWTPTEAQGPSTNTITTVVTDSGNPPLSATNSFTVVVNEVNVAPVLPGQTNRTLSGVATLVVTNTATDADIPANTLAYVLTGPTNAVIDTNGVITWTPSVAQVPSTNTFTTVVTDSSPQAVNSQHLSATNSFTVVVQAVHNGPSLPAQSDRTVNELTTLTVTNTAADVDVPVLTLTYQLVNPPTGAQISTNGVIAWTPTEAQGPGTNVLTTIVTDNGSPALSSTNSFTVVVNEINVAPTLPSQTNRTVQGVATLIVTNTASDADIPTNTLNYALTGPTNAVISTNGVITWTPVPSQVPSTNVFTTVVTDSNPSAVNSQNLSATNSFTVVASAVHVGPSLSAQPNRTVSALSAMSVTNTAIDTDVPLSVLTYSLLAAPTNAAISTNGVITWTPTLAQNNSTNTFTTRVVDNGTPALSATNTFTVVVNSSITIVLNSTSLAAEGCAPANGGIDPGETVTVLFSLKNTGGVSTTNLVATLLATNGVVAPSAPQSYGTLVGGGAAVTQPFTFSATGACGGTITARLQLQDGSSNYGTVTASLPLGANTTVLTQNFDSVTAPALPTGWTTAFTGFGSNWVTETTNRDTLPNAAYTRDSTNTGTSELDSPVIAMPSGSYQLFFKNFYDLEYRVGTSVGYDGGVLEIKIGTNAYVDILTAGGSFVTNGYNRLITNFYGNPLSNRPAWSGTSSGFTNTIVNLPASASGQNIQLRWRLGTDNGNGTSTPNTGWRIDSVAISGLSCCGNTAPTLPVQANRTIAELTALVVTNTATDSSAAPGTLTYTLVGPPAGAQIDTNGIIQWTPSEGQGPSTNTLMTIVSDNAFPPLSATNSFTVTVLDVNTAPVLPVQPDRTITKLALLTVTNTATDSDVPPNNLSYALLSAPAGAAIDSSGIITWTPNTNQSPSTNIFTTRVTDDGTPPLSATNSFQVFVDPASPPPPPLTIQSIFVSNGIATIMWNAVSGQVYRLEYEDDLSGSNWHDAPPDTTALGNTGISSTPLGGAAQRFFRVLLVP